MKIVKSKYSSEELQRIYDDAENKVEKDVVKKINRLNWVSGLLGAVVGLVCICASGKVCEAGIGNFKEQMLVGNVKTAAFMEGGGVVGAALLLFTGLYLIPSFPLFGELSVAFYEKRGHILSNPLTELKFPTYIEFVKAGETLSKYEAESNLLHLLKDGKLIVFEPVGARMDVIKEVNLHGFGYQIMQEDSDTLDFSCLDEDIDKCIVSAKENLRSLLVVGRRVQGK